MQFPCSTGAVLWLLSPICETEPMPRLRASPMATRIQVDKFFVLKLTDTLHEVREMGTPLLLGCLATNRGGWSVEEIEL